MGRTGLKVSELCLGAMTLGRETPEQESYSMLDRFKAAGGNFIDTANVDEIAEAAQLGVLDGVTTNPSLIAKTGRSLEEVAPEICRIEVCQCDGVPKHRDGRGADGEAAGRRACLPDLPSEPRRDARAQRRDRERRGGGDRVRLPHADAVPGR